MPDKILPGIFISVSAESPLIALCAVGPLRYCMALSCLFTLRSEPQRPQPMHKSFRETLRKL